MRIRTDGQHSFFAPAMAFVVAAFSLLLPASPAQAAPPTFVAVSAIAAAANGAADPTVTLPAHLPNDVLLLATIVRSGAATVATPAGWTALGGAVRALTATYQFFWIRAGAVAVTNPLIDRTATTGDVYAAAIVYRGAIVTGDPWEVKSTFTTGTADPMVYTGITTLTAESLVVVAVAGENDNNASITTTGTNPAAYTTHYLESATGANGVVTFSEASRATPGATGNISLNWNTANPVGSGGVVLALKPKTTFAQSAYRFFDNLDSTDVGTALAAQDTAANLSASGAPFRLRMLLHAAIVDHAISGQAFKLQFAARSGACDTAFTGEVYADVTAGTVIAYNNNPTPVDAANLTANANDPTHGADTVVNQTYDELNNFNNGTAAINAGQDGKWDFALIDNGAPANTTYCFRIVTDTGAVIDTYSVIPEITTAQGTKFYFHDAASPNAGTLPAATTMSAIAPNVTAATAGTNRDMDQTLGAAQASATLNTLANTALQRNWFRRFLSRPLAAQTLPTGIWNIQGGALENNAASNMLLWGAVIKVWRPSTGALVATLLDNPVLGTVEPGTTETNVLKATASITGVAVNDGDILVVELWAQNTQGNATARVNTIFYDGTTEGSTASNAAFLQAPKTISFYRSLTQSAYRLFNNADSTDVGTALAAQNTAAALGSGVAAFRLRTLVHVDDINLGAGGQALKLQFAGKGAGTCAAPSGTPGTYTDVTGATVIAYNNNATPADGAALTANASDPTHGADTVVNQTYEEANNFTNSSAINGDQDGKWDFSLVVNGAPLGTTYCFRVVAATGTALDFYTVYPEITTSIVPIPGSFNAFETTTAALAVSGVIKTKVAGTAFNLAVVSISGGAQQATFTDSVIVDLLANNTLGVALDAQNCPTSSTLLTPVPVNPTITGGRSNVSFNAVAEAWRDVRVRVRWPATTPSVTWCSNDNFAIRPASLVSVSVTDNDWETATPGTSRALGNVTSTGGNVHKAGRPFRITATAQNSAAVTTANYSTSPVAINVTRVLPTVGECAGCTAGTLNTGTWGAAAGVVTTTDASYSEAGSISMQLEDQTWSSVDASDGSTNAERFFSSAVFNVGRFVPDHFDVTTNSTPKFRTFGVADSACQTPPALPKRSFTYIGQTFDYQTVPEVLFTGKNVGGSTTSNYTASLIHTGSISAAQTYTPAAATLFTTIGAPTVAVGTPIGNGKLTINSLDTFSYVRSNTAPQSAFNANISLGVTVSDASEIGAGQGTITTTSGATFSSIGFDSGDLFRYGRLRILGAAGGEELPLPVPVQTEYWNGTGFIRNPDDHCTTLDRVNIAQGAYQKSLAQCQTIVSTSSVVFVSGAGRLVLTKPGTGNVGSVDLTPQLGAAIDVGSKYCTAVGGIGNEVAATAAAKSYLQGAWRGSATYDKNPSARAAFGVFGAQPRNFIFLRENY